MAELDDDSSDDDDFEYEGSSAIINQNLPAMLGNMQQEDTEENLVDNGMAKVDDPEFIVTALAELLPEEMHADIPLLKDLFPKMEQIQTKLGAKKKVLSAHVRKV
jgi:hypothetical protein